MYSHHLVMFSIIYITLLIYDHWKASCGIRSIKYVCRVCEDLTEGINIRFRTDGSIFYLRRVLARTKTLEVLILELLLAGDCALLAHCEKSLLAVVNRFANAAKAFGLTISLTKTKMLHQKPPRGTYSPPQITIDGSMLNTVQHFRYLGKRHFQRCHSCQGCQQPPRQSQHLFWPLAEARLEKTTPCVCHQRSWCTEPQLSPHSLLYGWEAWVLYRRQVRLLERFHPRFLRSIMGIKWQDYMINIEILELA